MDFGTRLKSLRQEQQLTQEELAQQLFVSRQSVSNWENNKGQPDLENLILISELFGTNLNDLIQPGKSSNNPEVSHGRPVGQVFAIIQIVWSLLMVATEIIFVDRGIRLFIFFCYCIGGALIQGIYLRKTKRLQNIVTQGEDAFDIGIFVFAGFWVGLLLVFGLLAANS
ncbi:helix-turn-helix domain-containing protein [Enterococcus sp. HY326]|uniref:helix-turn-helix domain-containing protein n=1 Tax=Enterococcus sp. HY326 TaxID=2971265 RepID=UPI00223FF2B6|nr:helix-turn-helix transcriptional regulator [Enterococcus sp. HY326]